MGGVCRLRARRHFCNTPHPAEGALLLHTGYAGNYYMKVQDYHTSVPAADFPCPQVFAPGSYTLSVFNLPEGMERADNRVGVASLPDGTLLPQPGVLYGNAATIGIAADDTLAVTLPMKQLTRRLTLKMKLAGATPAFWQEPKPP